MTSIRSPSGLNELESFLDVNLLSKSKPTKLNGKKPGFNHTSAVNINNILTKANQNQTREEKPMKAKLGYELTLTDAPVKVSRAIQRNLKILNPEYTEAAFMERNLRFIPAKLEFFEKYDNRLICPRGTVGMVAEEYSAHTGKKVFIHDIRRVLKPVNFGFQGELGPLLQKAADLIYQQTMGVWKAPFETDRIIMALYLIEQWAQPTMIVVETEELMKLWIDYFAMSSEIKASDVGIISDDEFRVGEKITVALVNSLYDYQFDEEINIGHLIIDERSSEKFVKEFLAIIQQFDCKYQLWLTSSSTDWGSFEEIVNLFAGPFIGMIDKQESLSYGNLCQGNAFFIPSGHKPIADPSVNYSHALTEMTQDLNRNKLIIETTKKFKNSGLTLILSDRQQHCEAIADLLINHYNEKDVGVITGDTPANQRQQIVEDLKTRLGGFLVATNQIIGKGFDLPGIETLVLATPVTFSSCFVQNILPALRPRYYHSRTVVLNFSDDHEVFESLAQKSWEKYKQLGFSVIGKI